MNGNLTVNKRYLTVTTNDASKFPTDPDPTFTGSDNLLAADEAQITWVYAPVGYSGAEGTFIIAATASDPHNRLANYIRNNSYGTFTVSTSAGAPSTSQLPDSVQKTSQIVVPSIVTLPANILPAVPMAPVILIAQPAPVSGTGSSPSSSNIPAVTCGYLDPNCHIHF